MPFQLCADFGPPIPAGFQPPPSFTLAAFDFLQLGGPQWSVNNNGPGGEQALQFPPQGMEITLPELERRVRLRIGAFNGPVDIEARDASGNTVSQKTVPDLDPNQYVNRTLSGPDKVIESVVLTQGGNEGGSTALNRAHAARAASNSHFGRLPRRFGIWAGITTKLISSSNVQR